MKTKRIFISIMAMIALFAIPSLSPAETGMDIVYNETDLGSGQWQYEYTFYNTSSDNESLFGVWFDFSQTAEITGSILMTGWDGTTWEGTHTTDTINTFSKSAAYDIPAGYSFGGFDFSIDHRAGDIYYEAYFETGSGTSSITGMTTAVAPEPASIVLFVIGGAALGLRLFKKSS